MFSKIYQVLDEDKIVFYIVKNLKGESLTTVSGGSEASWFAIHADNEFIGYISANEILHSMIVYIAQSTGVDIEETNLTYETERTLETDAFIISAEEDSIGKFFFGLDVKYRLIVNSSHSKDYVIAHISALNYDVGGGNLPPSSGR